MRYPHAVDLPAFPFFASTDRVFFAPELGASRVLSCMSSTVAVEGRSIFTGEPEYLAADTLRGLFPQTVCSEGEDMVSKPRLSYGQKVVDRTVLTSQSVPRPRHGSLGV